MDEPPPKVLKTMAELQAIARGGRPQRGIRCPNCGSTWWWVRDTNGGDNRVIRKRECRGCGRKLITKETEIFGGGTR